MGKRKKERKEFRYYEKPGDEIVISLTGEEWRRRYDNELHCSHFHNLLEIGYCHYGKGELLIDDHLYSYGKDMFSIIPANVLHATRSDENSICFWEFLFIDPEQILMEMYEKKSIEVYSIMETIHKKGWLHNNEDYPELSSTIRNIIEEMIEKKPFYRKSVDGLVRSLLIQIYRMNMEYEARKVTERPNCIRIKNAIDYAGNHYQESIKIRAMADVCHMSETNFRKVFEESMNISPVEYINLVRIEKACDLIRKTNHPMEIVAEKVGFKSVSSLTRNFKKVIGSTPYQWKLSPENYESKLLHAKIEVLRGWKK